MFNKIIRILEYSRYFSLPMTVLSWLIIFSYSLKDSGNILYGIISLIGICFVHLGTNLLDDFFDYRYVMKKLDLLDKNYMDYLDYWCEKYYRNGFVDSIELLKTI